MSTKQEQLKVINAKAKTLREEQKALREELNATKGDRKEARTTKAAARKSARKIKGQLRDLTAKVLTTLKKGTPEDIENLADEIIECSSQLSAVVRKFAEACKDPVVEGAEDKEGDDSAETTESTDGDDADTDTDTDTDEL